MKRFRVGGVVALAAGVFAWSGGEAFAQPVSRPAGVQLAQGDWNFVPVVTQDGGTISIPGILALKDKSADVGDNIVAVWYENPNAPATEWTAQAWESKDQWDAIKWVKEQYEIDDGYDFAWPTTDPMSEGGGSELPQDYFGGLLIGDPLFDFATQPDGDEIVAVLASVGYKAASIPVDKDGPCDTKVILPALADTTAFAILGQPPLEQVEAWFESLVPATCAQIVAPPPPPPAPTVPGTTIPQPGIPMNPGGPWQRDNRPGTLDTSCTTALTCCYQAPIIWLYTTTNWLGLTVIRYCEGEIQWSCDAPTGVPPAPCPPVPYCPEPAGPHLPAPPGPGVPAIRCGISYV
jgi:hypothetical protein